MTQEDLVLVDTVHTDLEISRAPEAILDEAKRAAVALKDVIDNKTKPVIFNGEQYIEFEDWQTLGKFYGLTVKVESTQYVEFGDVKGFEARAIVIHAMSGREISAAESMCLNDEPNWSRKPLFQLKSMAQTRAQAKAFRSCLAWVVVLAGYKATPAEEMDANTFNHAPIQPKTTPKAQPTRAPTKQAPKKVDTQTAGVAGEVVEARQAKKLYAIAMDAGFLPKKLCEFLYSNYGFASTYDVTTDMFDEVEAGIRLGPS